MLSFFRRLINSKLGIVVTFVVLGVIAVAFAAGDVTGLRNTTGKLTGDNVAVVGGEAIGTADLKSRVANAVEGARQQQPTLTTASFLAQGGLDGVLQQLINSIALDVFGHREGMAVSKRTVDGQIASIPGLQDAAGRFDPAIYQRLLADRHLTDAQVRSDIARDTIGQSLIVPTIGAKQVARQLALPYASLLLEKRAGQIGFVPTKAMGDGAVPTDAELQAFYQHNIARFSLPERRIARYAVVTPAAVAAKAIPTEAEIAQAYRRDPTRFAAKETRSISTVVVADQAGATVLAAKVKGGIPIADAARAAGLEALVRKDSEKAGYAAATSPAIADAVFAAAKGATVGPVRGALGFTIAHVDTVEQVAGKSLDQARGELVTELAKQKTLRALADIHDSLDDALGKNATFDEAAKDAKLAPLVTPALTAAGVNPDTPTVKPDPAMAPIVNAVFQIQEGDAPQLVQTAADGSFAIVGVGRILPAAARPLAQVRADVASAFVVDRARLAARALASALLRKVNAGGALAQVLAGSGKALPPVKPIGAARAQLASQRGAPPPLVLLFSMARGSAKMLEAPNAAGWFIIRLDTIENGDAAANPGVVAAAAADMGRVVGREYVQQLAKAIRDDVGVKTDPAAVARVRADLTGAGTN